MVADCGTNFFNTFLLKNGYCDVTSRLSHGFTLEEARSLIETMSAEKLRGLVFFNKNNDRDRLHCRRIVNCPLNLNGELAFVIIGSRAVSEGMTLLCVRSVHIMDPWWNESAHIQVQGRAIRNRSHARLPKEKRHVNIYKYTVSSKRYQSYDSMVYELCDRKFTFASEILEQIKERCQFFETSVYSDDLFKCDLDKSFGGISYEDKKYNFGPLNIMHREVIYIL